MLQFIILILLAISYYAGWQMCKSEWKFKVECKDRQIADIKSWKDYYCDLYEKTQVPEDIEQRVSDYRDELYEKWKLENPGEM